MRISDWSSDVCSSDLQLRRRLTFAKSDRRVAWQARGQLVGGAEGPPCQVALSVLAEDESTHLIGHGASRLQIDRVAEAGQGVVEQLAVPQQKRIREKVR